MAGLYKKLTNRRILWVLLGLGAAIVSALAVAAALSIPIRSETLKARVVGLLSDELESEVTIDSLEGRVFPRVGVRGSGVTIRHKGRTDVPPLITIAQFEIHGSLSDLLQTPGHVSEVRLQGLEIRIPPGDDRPDGEGSDSRRARRRS